MSIQSQVSKFVKNNTGVSLAKTKRHFKDLNENTIKSCYNRCTKDANKYAPDAYNATDLKNITLEKIEKLIITGKTPIPVLRVMLDLLKVKQQDQSELKEIDLDKFYKIGVDD